MLKQKLVKTFLFSILVLFSCGNLSAGGAESPLTIEEQVEGLWLYTGLTTSAGKDLPLTGIFLLKDGVFLQHAVFNGDPVKDQGAMAHAGSYSERGEFLHLTAEQTLSTAPQKEPSLTSQGRTEHDIAVSRAGNEMTFIFSKGTGTVQDFERVGSGTGEIYKLENGALALVDGYFILVSGDENGLATGYGTYENDNGSMMLNIVRWTDADQSSASNLHDSNLKASFDGQALTLDDGRSFQLRP